MRDVFGSPQSILIIGGNSDIARAILMEMVGLRRVTRVHIVTRSGEWVHEDAFVSRSPGVHVSKYKVMDFSITKDLATEEIDLCLISTGFLPPDNGVNAENIEESLSANLVVPIRFAAAAAEHMKRQGYGVIVGLSSIAAVRIRPDNWIYGLTKSGFDAFLQGLGNEVKDSGVTILTVRSGMVRTKMSRHLKEAPLTVDPEDVAIAIRENLNSSSSVVWVPRQLRLIGFILRLMPVFILKRLRD